MSENFLPGIYTLPMVKLEDVPALFNRIVKILSEKKFQCSTVGMFGKMQYYSPVYLASLYTWCFVNVYFAVLTVGGK